MLISLSFFLVFTMSLFFVGFFGIAFNRRSVLLVLLCIEVLLLSVNLNFIFYATFLDDFFGQLFALYILTVAAAESAIGLALIVVYYRVQGSLSMNAVNLLHGLLLLSKYKCFFHFLLIFCVSCPNCFLVFFRAFLFFFIRTFQTLNRLLFKKLLF